MGETGRDGGEIGGGDADCRDYSGASFGEESDSAESSEDKVAPPSA